MGEWKGEAKGEVEKRIDPKRRYSSSAAVPSADSGGGAPRAVRWCGKRCHRPEVWEAARCGKPQHPTTLTRGWTAGGSAA